MARLVPVSTLIEDTRRWANIRTSSPDDAHLTDGDVLRVLELKLAEFHEMLTSATATDFMSTEAEVAIIDGAGDLPDDFFRLNAAWIEWSADRHESLTNLANQQDATLFQGFNWTDGEPKAFRVVGNELRVYPPAATAAVQIAYVPAFLATATEYDGVNGWEKYVTMGAAIELMAIENRTNPTLANEYAKQEERVRSMVEERQAQDAPKVRDVASTFRPRLGGWSGGP